MSEGKKVPTDTPETSPGDAAAAPCAREKESGRVAFDARGNPVWEWRTGDGQFARDASTSLVRKLEAPQLSLEATAIARKRDGSSPQAAAPSCGGFDPYDSGAEPASNSPTASRPTPTRPPGRPAAVPRRAEPGLLQKLQSWIGGKGSSRAR